MPFPQFNVLKTNRRPSQGQKHYYERQFYDFTVKIELFININYDFIIWTIITFILTRQNPEWTQDDPGNSSMVWGSFYDSKFEQYQTCIIFHKCWTLMHL